MRKKNSYGYGKQPTGSHEIWRLHTSLLRASSLNRVSIVLYLADSALVLVRFHLFRVTCVSAIILLRRETERNSFDTRIPATSFHMFALCLRCLRPTALMPILKRDVVASRRAWEVHERGQRNALTWRQWVSHARFDAQSRRSHEERNECEHQHRDFFLRLGRLCDHVVVSAVFPHLHARHVADLLALV